LHVADYDFIWLGLIEDAIRIFTDRKCTDLAMIHDTGKPGLSSYHGDGVFNGQGYFAGGYRIVARDVD